MKPCHFCLPACTCHNAKGMIQGNIYQKLKDAAIPLKKLEPYTFYSNTAEEEINELMKWDGHTLLQPRAPKHLWDD